MEITTVQCYSEGMCTQEELSVSRGGGQRAPGGLKGREVTVSKCSVGRTVQTTVCMCAHAGHRRKMAWAPAKLWCSSQHATEGDEMAQARTVLYFRKIPLKAM